MLLPPNIALLAWPVVVIVLFRAMPRKEALLVGLLWGYLLLPERFNIDLPLLPPVDKRSISAFAVLICLFLFKEKFAARGPKPDTPLQINENPNFGILILSLMTLMFLNAVMTVFTNLDPLFFGPLYIPGLGVRDLISEVVDTMVLVAPYFLGRAFFRTPEDHRMLLRSLVLAGLVYTLFVLIEVRLSPQLHNWVYGYHQHSFAQHIRGGAYRAKVFLQHGLWVGMFLLTVVLAAGALYRSKANASYGKFLIAAGYLFAILYLSRNLGAFALAILFLPLLWLRIAIQVRIAAVIALIFISYPAVRQADLVPLDQISAISSSISEERADSFMFRLRHEDMLLERASEKPLFGWGGWGRNRIFTEDGRDVSVTDGIWTIILGVNGWVGYVTFFGLLCAPLIMLPRTLNKRDMPPETAAIALILAANLIYLIPNSALSPLGWLLAGALAGYVQYRQVVKSPDADVAGTSQETTDASPYTRFPH